MLDAQAQRFELRLHQAGERGDGDGGQDGERAGEEACGTRRHAAIGI